MGTVSRFSYKGPIFSADDLPSQTSADRLRRDIAVLESARDAVGHADDQEDPCYGELQLILSAAVPLRADSPSLEWRAGGSSVTSNTENIGMDPSSDETTPDAHALAATSQELRPPATAVLSHYRPVHHWLRPAKLARDDLPPPPVQPTPVSTTAVRAQAAGRYNVPIGGLVAGRTDDDIDDINAAWQDAYEELLLVTVVVRLNRLQQLREGLLQLIRSTLIALRRALTLVLAAFARRPDVLNFVLILVAVSRRYGRRSDSDDHALPAHRSTSVIGGEPALNR